jgi:hypothetical protein
MRDLALRRMGDQSSALAATVSRFAARNSQQTAALDRAPVAGPVLEPTSLPTRAGSLPKTPR